MSSTNCNVNFYYSLTTGSIVTIKRTKYTVKESDGFVDITILVDTPNCHAITVTVYPKEQTPVDASGKNKTT